MKDRELLNSYRLLWVNRSIPVHNNEKETIRAAIKKDLLDEMTHPRLRKSPYFKFHSSIKRISSSSLCDQDKLELIKLHLDVFDQLTEK